MKTNVGGIDQAVRIIAGLILLSLIFILDGTARWWGLAGIVPLFTGTLGWCPLYTLLGLDTCPARS